MTLNSFIKIIEIIDITMKKYLAAAMRFFYNKIGRVKDYHLALPKLESLSKNFYYYLQFI